MIFIRLGGEMSISQEYLQTGLMYDFAKQLKALLIIIEHRFYGKSQPING